ncbi:MAG: hypothetical protein ABI595_15980 [Actinomycetota bacterium]
METMPVFVLDQLYLIGVAVFALASVAIIRRSRRDHPPPSGHARLAGLRTAALASVVPLVALALVGVVLAWLLRGMFWDYNPTIAPPTVNPIDQVRDNVIALLWLISIPGVTFLAVLDLYAIRPPRAQDQASKARTYAALGTLFSLSLLGGTLLATTVVNEAISSAAKREAEEARSAERDRAMRAREARSAGLSMVVTVADAQAGATTARGRILSRLVLDVTVRSTSDIELSRTPGGVDTPSLVLLNQDAYYVEITAGLRLPSRIPAGFETTYHLDVPTEWSCSKGMHVVVPEPCETTPDGQAAGPSDWHPPVTGPWDATFRFSNDAPYDDSRYLDYSTATEFTVSANR